MNILSLRHVSALLLGVVLSVCLGIVLTAQAATVTGTISVLPEPINPVSDTDGEYVTITNTGTADMILDGWSIYDTLGSPTLVHVFPASTTLTAGQSITICSNTDSGANGGITDCVADWGIAKWNNGIAGDTLVLENASNTVVASIVYTDTVEGEVYSSNFNYDDGVVDPGLEILTPAEDEVVGGSYEFTAKYIDADDSQDNIFWAIRPSDSCGATTTNIVEGLAMYADGNISEIIDMSGWEDGDYCWVVNPREKGVGEDFREVVRFTLENPVEATLDILTPAESEVVGGMYTFTAQYNDQDEIEDHINWAIRFETCNKSTGAVAGNVDGFNSPYTVVDGLLSADIDTSVLAEGEYCFVVNPAESGDSDDLRETRWFTIDQPLVCEPGVNLLGNHSFEEPVVTASKGWGILSPVAWIVKTLGGGSDADMEIHRGVNGWTSSNGAQHTEIASDQALVISQIVEALPGYDYTLTWDYSARPNESKPESKMDVRINGEKIATNNAAGGASTEWRSKSYSFFNYDDEIEVSFEDVSQGVAGRSAFLDNVSLTCSPTAAYAPYCGDGTINQEWEQCEVGDENCTNYCTYANQCSQEEFIKITLEDTKSTSFDDRIYLGSAGTFIPSGTWFKFYEEGDVQVNTIANAVDGLAVERDTETGELKIGFRGGNSSNELDFAIGTIEFVGLEAGLLTRSVAFTDYALEGDESQYPDTWEEVNSQTIAFDMRVKADGKDGAVVAVNDATQAHDCPACLATIEARIVLGEAGFIQNDFDGNLAEMVILGDGSEVAFGEWFEVFDGTAYVDDVDTVTSFSDSETLEGLFVSREGNGEVKVALYGSHDNSETQSREYIVGRLEFRDAFVDGSTLAELNGGYGLETHGESGYDETSILPDDSGVAFALRVGTGNDGFKVAVDEETIVSCEEDTREYAYIIDGYKWNDENGDGFWDEGEDPLADWVITADNGVDTPLSTTTDEMGYYWFEVLEGEWEVSETNQYGWQQTAANAYGWYPIKPKLLDIESPEVTLTCSFDVFPGQDEEIFFSTQFLPEPENDLRQGEFDSETEILQTYSCEFGNQYVAEEISGYKWSDVDGDGIRDEDESLISGWEIVIYDGVTLATTTTDETGYYSFMVEPGMWTVSETQVDGWTQTFPESGACEIEVIDEAVTCNFGNQPDPEVVAFSGGGGVSISLTPNSSNDGSESDREGVVLGAATSQCGPYLLDYMKQGDANSDWEVTKLQLFLVSQGLVTDFGGTFGDSTTAGVRLFQSNHSSEVLQPWVDAGLASALDPTGYVYKTTQWKINDIVCPGVAPFPQLP